MNGAHLNALFAHILWTGRDMNGMKLCQGKFRLDIRRRFFTERVVGHWKRIPREVVMTPSLSELKECLDNALSHRL